MRRYVAERIKKLREAQDMSLEQVARMTGIDTAKLRAYEQGEAVPPIGTVIQLSRVFGSKMEGLLHGGMIASENLTICRSGESMAGDRGDTEQGYAYASLTRPGTSGHLMEPFMLRFDPAVPQGVPITHDGQEFVHVIDGSVELFYNGQTYRLERGDSAYLDSRLPHTFHGIGASPAQVLAVVSS
jgi:transcriptional regulator with XRE-family HTH domain